MKKTTNHLHKLLFFCCSLLLFGGVSVGHTQPVAGEPIRLQATTFVPTAQQAVRLDLLQANDLTNQPAYYLVQFSGHIRPEWRQALVAAGGDIVAYVPENAFKVRLTAAQTAVVAQLPHVHWIGAFLPAYKLSPNLIQGQPALFRVRLEAAANKTEIATAIAQSGATLLQQTEDLWLVAANFSQLETIAAIAEVAWIENYMLPETHNEYGAGVVVGANIANSSGYDGSTQTAAVADTGLGGGTLSTAHPDIPSSRMTSIYSWPGTAGGCFNTITDDGAIDVDSGHGTHTAVSVVGDGGASGEGKGTAPAANLVFQAVESWATVSFFCQLFGGYPASGYFLTGLPTDLGDLYQQAYDDGARIHSNSWGSNQAGAYTANSADTDQFVWDNPDMLITFSAGNSGTDSNADGVVDNDSIGSPATAKNVLTVGASEGDRQGNYQCDSSLPYTSPDPYQTGQTCSSMGGDQGGFLGTAGSRWGFATEPLASDVTAGNSEQMAPFSSRGPTDDGRIKPDVVAPGTWILSGYSERHQQGYSDPTNPQNGSYQSDGWGMPVNAAYKYFGGTSMSNPIAAGAATVVRDFYEKTDGHNASAALVKATLINSAVDLLDENNDGANDNDFPIPNIHEGWGRIDLAAATDGSHQYVDETTGINTGATSSYQFETTLANLPLRVTLVWSDYPSTEAAMQNLVNNLNLRVTDPTGTAVYWGNNFSNGWSVTGGSADSINNVENVYVQAAATGTWTVEVIGANVPQGPQPFALVVDGAMLAGCKQPATVTVAPNGSNIGLDWSAVSGAVGYEVWWEINSYYFAPGADCETAVHCTLVTDETFTHSGVTYNADNNYTYLVTASNCTAPEDEIAHWSIFSFDLIPGTP